MNLESVRALKEELRHGIAMEGSTHDDPVMAILRAETRDQNSGASSVGLGVALPDEENAHDGYKLSALVPSAPGRRPRLVQALSEKAHGEIIVRHTGRLPRAWPGKAYGSKQRSFRRRRPLEIGASISHAQENAAGTLGAFVEFGEAEKATGLLTNNHVIARLNQANSDDAIIQPGGLDGGVRPDNTGDNPGDKIAELAHYIHINMYKNNEIDAAVARLDASVDFDADTLPEGRTLSKSVAPIPGIRVPVWKMGRTTGWTQGRVIVSEINITVQMGAQATDPIATFNDVFVIEGWGKGAFSKSGDSGSVIVNGTGDVIGLLFAGNDKDRGGSNGRGLTYAIPIEKVLGAFHARLI